MSNVTQVVDGWDGYPPHHRELSSGPEARRGPTNTTRGQHTRTKQQATQTLTNCRTTTAHTKDSSNAQPSRQTQRATRQHTQPGRGHSGQRDKRQQPNLHAHEQADAWPPQQSLNTHNKLHDLWERHTPDGRQGCTEGRTVGRGGSRHAESHGDELVMQPGAPCCSGRVDDGRERSDRDGGSGGDQGLRLLRRRQVQLWHPPGQVG